MKKIFIAVVKQLEFISKLSWRYGETFNLILLKGLDPLALPEKQQSSMLFSTAPCTNLCHSICHKSIQKGRGREEGRQ
jgi:hypothetical protein